ncbi:hypothetical protein A8146_07455 [Mesorhizobium loti]|nr:hypothetical protein A8146_07455 [Mesorhizobium loti]
MQFADLRRPAALQVVPHRRACLRVDRQHAPRQQFEQPVRQPQHLRQQRRPQPGDPRWLDAGGLHRQQGLVDLAGQDQPPAAIGEFARQRQSGQRHQRVVEVHQKLAP